MKVFFLKEFSGIPQGPFAAYSFREDLCAQADWVDIRAIVAVHESAWLNDLALAHGQLSETILRSSPWWWLTGFSRLDARPWGGETVIKPLFFARAILAWGQARPSNGTITLVGCPNEVAFYLKDFEPGVSIEGLNEGQMNCRKGLGFVKEWLRTVGKFVQQLVTLLLRCWSSHQDGGAAHTLVIYERFTPSMSPTQACDYYYDRLFSSPGLQEPGQLRFACLDQISFGFQASPKDSCQEVFFILKNMTLSDFLFVAWHNIGLIASIVGQSLGQPTCTIDGMVSRTFWRQFLLGALSQSIVLKELGVYRVLKRQVVQKKCECIVYPYEEKGYERAILLACQGQATKTIGYCPHPQHHLALSMKDTVENSSLRPSLYAVCGPLYLDYFQQWAGKSREAVHVWGSAKSCDSEYASKAIPKELKALLLLSHPHELDVFASWLRAEPTLCQSISYLVRSYQAVPGKMFQKRFEAVTKEFPIVSESPSGFNASVAAVDCIIFNATSAGLLAINRGKIAVHARLDDFFAINPCFDNLEFMLSCASACELADRLEALRCLRQEQVQVVWQGQKNFVAGVFSPIDVEAIERDLLCCAD